MNTSHRSSVTHSQIRYQVRNWQPGVFFAEKE
jgi:hypothetical protein